MQYMESYRARRSPVEWRSSVSEASAETISLLWLMLAAVRKHYALLELSHLSDLMTVETTCAIMPRPAAVLVEPELKLEIHC